MTLEEASQIYYINKEIKKIQLDIEKLESSRTFSRAITYSDMPKGNIRDTTEYIDDYLDERQQLQDMLRYSLQRLQKERLKMEKFLNTINDAEIRLIIRLRCVNGMNWREIGEEMGAHRTSVSKKFYDFWQKN